MFGCISSSQKQGTRGGTAVGLGGHGHFAAAEPMRPINLHDRATKAYRSMAEPRGTSVFATVSRLDGRFGFEARQPLVDPLSGGLIGLTKSAACEWPELNCKAFDLSDGWTSASEIATRVVDELFRKGPVEIGLSQQGRFLLLDA